MQFQLSDQFWLSVLVQVVIGVAVLAMMKQQLRDLVGWVKSVQGDVKELQTSRTDHEGRISHVEGRLNVERGER
jgi:hypothetical protein